MEKTKHDVVFDTLIYLLDSKVINESEVHAMYHTIYSMPDQELFNFYMDSRQLCDKVKDFSHLGGVDKPIEDLY